MIPIYGNRDLLIADSLVGDTDDASLSVEHVVGSNTSGVSLEDVGDGCDLIPLAHILQEQIILH